MKLLQSKKSRIIFAVAIVGGVIGGVFFWRWWSFDPLGIKEIKEWKTDYPCTSNDDCVYSFSTKDRCGPYCGAEMINKKEEARRMAWIKINCPRTNPNIVPKIMLDCPDIRVFGGFCRRGYCVGQSSSNR